MDHRPLRCIAFSLAAFAAPALAASPPPPDSSYRYRVLNSSVPNAFALPGEFIVINRGLLVGLKSEAELAAVLGHETGHVTAKHSLAGYQRAVGANVVLA